MFPGLRTGQIYYKPPSQPLFLLKQGVPFEALLFDGLSDSTHQEALTIAALLTAQHWHSALVAGKKMATVLFE